LLLPFGLSACGEEPQVRSLLSVLLIETEQLQKGRIGCRTSKVDALDVRHARLV